MTRIIKNCVGMFVLALTIATQVSAKTPENIFEEVSASVVIVDVLDAKGEKTGHGSGVVVATGTVVTNCHVTDEATFLQVRWKGIVYSATLEYHHPYQDLCIVSAPDLDAPNVRLSATQNLKIGSRVFAIGAPRGLELTMSDGIVSGLRNVDASVLIQTNAAISPGSSGGGLFNEDGRLVGITTWLMRESQNLNFALSADLIPVAQAKMEIARSQRAKDQLLKIQQRQAETRKLAEATKAIDEARQQHEKEKRIQEEQDRLRQADENRLADAIRQREAEDAKTPEGQKRLAEAKREQIRLNEELARQQTLAELQTVIVEYKDRIRSKIKQNFSVAGTIDPKRPAVYSVVLLPTGEVLEVKLLESSGHTFYDEAVERAILRSQPLPLPPNPQLFGYFRELRLPIDFQGLTDTNLRTVRIIQKFKPPYPRQALRMGVEGKVSARLAITEDGSVAGVEILESAPPGVFDKAVKDTLFRYKLEPDGTAYYFDHVMIFRIERVDDSVQSLTLETSPYQTAP